MLTKGRRAQRSGEPAPIVGAPEGTHAASPRTHRRSMVDRRTILQRRTTIPFETAMTGIGRELPTIVASQFAMKRPFASSHELISVQPVVAALRPICHHFRTSRFEFSWLII